MQDESDRVIGTVLTEADLPPVGLRQVRLVAGRDPWEDLPSWIQNSASGDTGMIVGYGIQASGWGWQLRLAIDVTCRQSLLHGTTQALLPAGQMIPAGTPVDCSATVGHVFTEFPEGGSAHLRTFTDLVYVTQDTGHFWEWSGHEWVDAGPYRQPGGWAGETGFFVAPGDLVDHTSVLQAGIDNLSDRGGGRLTLQRGTFRISSTLILRPGVSLHGSGQAVTTIDATWLPAGAAGVHVVENSTGAALSDFTLRGARSRNSIGVHLGPAEGITEGATVDFTVTNLRIESFHRGITARYAWCGVFTGVRVHICRTALEFGSQVNAVRFHGWLTSFTESAAILTNVEGITFDTTSIESVVSTRPALQLFQSQVVLIQPYVEFVPALALVGHEREDDRRRSTFASLGGRLCGTLTLGGRGTRVSVTAPWLISSPPGAPFAIDVAEGDFSAQPGHIRFDGPDGVPGIGRVRQWDCRSGAWPLEPAAEGEDLRVAQEDDHFKVTSPAAWQGIDLGSLEVGEQYVFSYRARKAGGGVWLREEGGRACAIATVECPTAGFQVVHTPFVARGTSLTMLWCGGLDLQWLSLVHGLHFLDRGQ